MLLEKKPDVILLDDAFQHRKVKAGLNILLTTFGDLYIDDYVLPTGNLREFRVGVNRAQVVVVTKCPANLSKEKQDKIEALENRSASEKTAQKREERLLSSTIYELGLAIMQNRLKER